MAASGQVTGLGLVMPARAFHGLSSTRGDPLPCSLPNPGDWAQCLALRQNEWRERDSPVTSTPWGWGGQVPSLRGSVYVVGWEAHLPLRTSWGLGHSLPLPAWLPGWGLRLVSGPSEPRQVPGASSLPQNTYLPLPGVGSQVNSAEGSAARLCLAAGI